MVLPTDNEALITALIKLGGFFVGNEAKIGDLFNEGTKDKSIYSGSTKIKQPANIKDVSNNTAENSVKA